MCAAQFIPRNIAEGNGKRRLTDRSRFFDIARGSALEGAAIQDVLVIYGALSRDGGDSLKRRLTRMVTILTRLAMRADQVSETVEPYHAEVDVDYDDEHEHRFAEHEL